MGHNFKPECVSTFWLPTPVDLLIRYISNLDAPRWRENRSGGVGGGGWPKIQKSQHQEPECYDTGTQFLRKVEGLGPPVLVKTEGIKGLSVTKCE